MRGSDYAFILETLLATELKILSLACIQMAALLTKLINAPLFFLTARLLRAALLIVFGAKL